MTKSPKKRPSRRTPGTVRQEPPTRPASTREPLPPVTVRDEPPSARRRALPLFLLSASFVGFAISTYLMFTHYRGSIPPCHVVQGCETVQTSRYSEILGIPLALFGTAFFALMFYLAIGLLTSGRSLLVSAYKLLAFAGALAAIPLFLLQAVVLEAFCSWCLMTEVMMLGMWAGSFFLRGRREEQRGGELAFELQH